MKIDNYKNVITTLEQRGYSPRYQSESDTVALSIHGVLAVLSITDSELQVVARVCDVSELPDLSGFAVAALETNSTIRPFAFETVENEDGEPETIVLADSFSFADLSDEELMYHIEKLESALITASKVAQIVTAQEGGGENTTPPKPSAPKGGGHVRNPFKGGGVDEEVVEELVEGAVLAGTAIAAGLSSPSHDSGGYSDSGGDDGGSDD